MIAAPQKRPRVAGDIEKYQPPSVSVFQTVQTTADQLPDKDNISPKTGELLQTTREFGL